MRSHQVATRGSAGRSVRSTTSDARTEVATAIATGRTLATSRAGGSVSSSAAAGNHTGGSTTDVLSQPAWARAVDSIRYVFVFLRGQVHAGERRRSLAQEREGAERLTESALFDLGAAVLREGLQGEALTGLLEELGRAQARREAAISDLAAAEKAQAAEDLRLGIEQSACEAEWTACDAGAREVEEMLRGLERERQEASAALSRASRSGADPRTPLEDRLARLKQQEAGLRDRAAALRASTVAARAKLDRAVAARRDTGAAMAASITGHARERATAERQIRELTVQIGGVAAEKRPRNPALFPLYERIDRLRDTIEDRQRQIAQVERMAGHFDRRKLAAGLGLLGSVLGVLGVAIWALLR